MHYTQIFHIILKSITISLGLLLTRQFYKVVISKKKKKKNKYPMSYPLLSK